MNAERSGPPTGDSEGTIDLLTDINQAAERLGLHVSARGDSPDWVVALLPLGHEHLAMHRVPDGTLEITVRTHIGRDLVAWGHVDDVDTAAEIMHLWNTHTAAEALGAVIGYLTIADDDNPGAMIQAEWGYIATVENDALSRLIRAVYGMPPLRELLPHISHGALGLLRGKVGRQTHEVMFRRHSNEPDTRWSIDFYRAEPVGAPPAAYRETNNLELHEAVALAAEEVARNWPR